MKHADFYLEINSPTSLNKTIANWFILEWRYTGKSYAIRHLMIGYETVASFSNTDESITMCYHQTSSINVMTLTLKFLFTCFEALKEKNSMLSNSNDNEYTLQSVQCAIRPHTTLLPAV